MQHHLNHATTTNPKIECISFYFYNKFSQFCLHFFLKYLTVIFSYKSFVLNFLTFNKKFKFLIKYINFFKDIPPHLLILRTNVYSVYSPVQVFLQLYIINLFACLYIHTYISNKLLIFLKKKCSIYKKKDSKCFSKCL